MKLYLVIVRNFFLFLVVLVVPLKGVAAESVSLDEYESNKGIWRLGLNINYAVSNTDDAQIGDTVLIETSPGQFVQIPITISNASTSSEHFVITPSIGYGISKRDRITVRASFSNNNTRNDTGVIQESDSYGRFDNGWISYSHNISRKGKKIMLSTFLDIALAENTKTKGMDIESGRSFLFGVTMYSFYDPVVMSLTSGYGLNLERTSNDQTLEPGDFLFISPELGFIPNQDAELSLGFILLTQQAPRVDGNKVGVRQTKIDLNIWYAYAWSRQLSLFTNFQANVSGREGASVGVFASYDLGRN